MLARAIDTDNYDGPVAVEVFQQLKDSAGVLSAIVGTQVGVDGNHYTEIQRDNARAAGLVVAQHYDFLYFDPTGVHDLERMKWAASFGLPVCIDEETDVNGFSPAQVVDRIGRARDVLISEGLFGAHYTNPDWWATKTNNSQAFAGDPLWLATWPYGNGVLPPLDFLPTFVPGSPAIGGMLLWAQQYADICYPTTPATNFDLDVVVLPDAPPPTPAPAAYLTRMERTDYFSDGTIWHITGAYDPPPTG